MVMDRLKKLLENTFGQIIFESVLQFYFSLTCKRLLVGQK